MKLLNKLKEIYSNIVHIQFYTKTILNKIESENAIVKMQLGHLLSEQMLTKGIVDDLKQVEFKVFSQTGEDGIIQYLIHHVNPPKNFIEFGVENYKESNTRFLLRKNNWKGLVLDGSKENINIIKNSEEYITNHLFVEHAFITKENINELIINNNFNKEIGILSIDVDGNDYWIWDSINCINPEIVVCEYNALFGNERKISVPYDANFVNSKAHYSCLFFGASLPAKIQLANQKGYTFVGNNSNASNAFFVRNDKIGNIKKADPRVTFCEPYFRSSRDKNGNLTYLSNNDRYLEIKGLPVINIDTMNEEIL
ncbi:MAG: hypothetical protein U0V72_02285 [Cytophagales bacterium]